jgi:hypothetical protein
MNQRSRSRVVSTPTNRWVGVLVLALGLAMNGMTAVASADQLPAMAVAYQSGNITGIYETTFQIDHKTYSLTPDAVLLDRHGDELNTSDLRVDIAVKYHLQKDSKEKIDRMILFLPE